MTRGHTLVPLLTTGLVTALITAGLTAALPAPAGAAPVSTVVTQSETIYLNDGGAEVASPDVLTFETGAGQATVYPSVFSFPHLGEIVDVDVRIGNFTHAHPDDVQLVLSQQGGPQVTLMANAGGSTAVNDLPISFDDESALNLPDETPLTGGGYRPRVYGAVSQLPPPAPPVVGNSSLAVFDGLPASSTWRLFAFDDDSAAFTGSLSDVSITVTYATSPYPSTLDVSGVGAVQDLDVSVYGLTSTYPDDLDLLLIGPDSTQVILMSDVGGSEDLGHIDLTFDDEAPVGLADEPGEALAAGSYQPTDANDGVDDSWPDVLAATRGTSLAAFDGTDPNGTWQLFAVDDTDQDLTRIDAGWSLDIEWDDSAAPTGSLSIAGGTATTSTRTVSVTLSAADPAPGTGVTDMRLSNDGTTFSAYIPFATTTSWTLTPGDGVKTVYAQFRDAVGNESDVVSDDIELQAPIAPADATSPGAKKLRPAPGARGVSPKAKVKVVATEALDPSTVTRQTVVLKRKGVTVRAQVTYRPKGHAIVLVPKKRLKPGSYLVTVSSRVTDLAGNGFDGSTKAGLQPLKWRFRV